MTTRSSHSEMVKAILDSKAIDFAAIGKLVAQVGPSRSLLDEPWEEFCGTMRYFIRFYKLPPIVHMPQLPTLAEMGQFRELSGELRGQARQ